MQALETLAPEDRERVLRSAAALYGVGISSQDTTRKASASSSGVEEAGEDGLASGKQVSLVEFLKDKQPATHAQYLAAFAYYREHVEGKGATFSSADLREYYATAKLSRPSKYDREWTKVVREGWIHDAGGASYLTQAGEAKVQAGFGGKAKPRGSSASKKGKKAPAKPTAE